MQHALTFFGDPVVYVEAFNLSISRLVDLRDPPFEPAKVSFSFFIFFQLSVSEVPSCVRVVMQRNYADFSIMKVIQSKVNSVLSSIVQKCYLPSIMLESFREALLSGVNSPTTSFRKSTSACSSHSQAQTNLPFFFFLVLLLDFFGGISRKLI